MRMMVLSWCHAWINVPMCLWNFFSWQYEIRQRLDLALNYFLLAIDLRDSFWTFIRELNLGSQSSCYSMQQLIWEFLRGSCIVLQIISLLLSLSFYMCTEILKTWPNHSRFFGLDHIGVAMTKPAMHLFCFDYAYRRKSLDCNLQPLLSACIWR